MLHRLRRQLFTNLVTDPSSLSDFSLSSKLAIVPEELTESFANQGLSKLVRVGNTITVSAPLDDLTAFDSNNEAQGSGKWIGILIGTGLPSIIGVKYGSYALATDDVAEAASVGGVAGEFVLWIKAEVVVDTPKTFTLYDSTGKHTYATVTVNVVDTSEE